jgi:hypothetical protein
MMQNFFPFLRWLKKGYTLVCVGTCLPVVVRTVFLDNVIIVENRSNVFLSTCAEPNLLTGLVRDGGAKCAGGELPGGVVSPAREALDPPAG